MISSFKKHLNTKSFTPPKSSFVRFSRVSLPERLRSFSRASLSFTLIELLIVIAILALLMSIVIISINPSEMLKKSRDTKRISSLKALNNALGIFQATKPTTTMGTANIVYVSIPDSSSTCANLSLPTLPSGYTYQCSTSANYRKTDGTGWIPVNFDSLDIGSPISSLPIDPTNTTSTGLYFTYVTGGSWEMRAQLESEGQEQAINDGDAFPGIYSVGTTLNLTPAIRDRGLVGYWDFDEGSGTTAYDRSGNQNNGILTGSTWKTSSDCIEDNCLYFDGDDYITTPSFAFSGTVLTVSGWIKSKQIGTVAQTILGEGVIAPNNYIWIYRGVADDRLRIRYYDGTTDQAAIMETFFTNYNDIWTYFVIVCDYSGKITRFYRDGTLIQTSTMVGNPVFPSTNRVKYIGNYNNNAITRNLTEGSLDDLRIYNRELNASEIKAIYDATK